MLVCVCACVVELYDWCELLSVCCSFCSAVINLVSGEVCLVQWVSELCVCLYRYIYYNATDISSIANSSSSHDLSHHYLSIPSHDNDSSYVTTSAGLIELNVGLASNRIYNVLYENVAYCLVAFLVPLATLVVFNVRLVVQLRRSRHLRRTLRPLVMYARDGPPHRCRAATHRRQTPTHREDRIQLDPGHPQTPAWTSQVPSRDQPRRHSGWRLWQWLQRSGWDKYYAV